MSTSQEEVFPSQYSELDNVQITWKQFELKCKAPSRLEYFTHLFFIVGQCVLVYGDDVHVRVAVVFPDFLQLWICFIDISIQLQKQES